MFCIGHNGRGKISVSPRGQSFLPRTGFPSYMELESRAGVCTSAAKPKKTQSLGRAIDPSVLCRILMLRLGPRSYFSSFQTVSDQVLSSFWKATGDLYKSFLKNVIGKQHIVMCKSTAYRIRETWTQVHLLPCDL